MASLKINTQALKIAKKRFPFRKFAYQFSYTQDVQDNKVTIVVFKSGGVQYLVRMDTEEILTSDEFDDKYPNDVAVTIRDQDEDED